MLEDSSGCVATDTSLIIVSTEFPVYLPNAFSPTSSHPENAVFRPFGTHKIRQVNDMRIFNRWGSLVYERTNFPGNDPTAGWDGSSDGSPLESGVYLYSLELLFIDGSVRQYAGDVTLIR
jgi:gliding motility-associated-like protein